MPHCTQAVTILTAWKRHAIRPTEMQSQAQKTPSSSPEAVRQNNGSGTSLAPVLCPVLRCPSYSSAVGSAIWGTQGQMVTEEK